MDGTFAGCADFVAPGVVAVAVFSWGFFFQHPGGDCGIWCFDIAFFATSSPKYSKGRACALLRALAGGELVIVSSGGGCLGLWGSSGVSSDAGCVVKFDGNGSLDTSATHSNGLDHRFNVGSWLSLFRLLTGAQNPITLPGYKNIPGSP